MDYEIGEKKYSSQELQNEIGGILTEFLLKIQKTSPNFNKSEEEKRKTQLSSADSRIYEIMKEKNLKYYANKYNLLQKFDEEQDVNGFLKEFFDLHNRFDGLLNKIKLILNSNRDKRNLDVLIVDNSFKHMKIYIKKLLEVNNSLSYDIQTDKAGQSTDNVNQ